jgi:6-pyruvoyltetrahydropterin/6-carboxytetrahydropterin synthase
MSGSYTLKVLIDFSAAHSLRGYVGDCARVHGHNWKIEAEIKTKSLNDIGIAVDFKDVRRAMEEISDILDHQYLNEIPPFDTINPTAENMAAWFYKQLAPQLIAPTQKLLAISLWETERSSVRYSEDD